MIRIALLCMSICLLSAQKIKFGTVAPKGSAWYKVMKEFADAVKKETSNKVKFKIYAGGIQGDESQMLKRMRVGQLHAGGFIGPGLGQIVPDVRIFDLPFMFESYEEVDHVQANLLDYFRKKFDEKGFYLLAWAEAGFVNVFSTEKIQSYNDLKKAKIWSLADDPISDITFKALDVNPYSVPLTDVLTSLETGLVNTTYTPPLGAVTLQWFKKQTYFIDINLAFSSGAVIISKKAWDKISSEHQEIINKTAKTYFKKFNDVGRKSNEESKQVILDEGLKKLEVKDLTPFKKAGEVAKKEAIGKLFDQELLNKVDALIKEKRKK